jgi:hypothetical protein
MIYSVETIARWRGNARQAWARQFPIDTPDGWSISPVDLSKIVDVFPSLKLKPGMVLRAYQFRQKPDGHSVVFAMPAGEALPALKGKVKQPARPTSALDDIMTAIEGDGSLESYMQASILLRELQEFGTLGHGSNWELYHVLGDKIWSSPPLDAVSPTQTTPSGVPGLWNWKDQQPEDYRPRAEHVEKAIKTSFYVYSALGQERIIHHEDLFQSGSYIFKTSSKTIGTGPLNYVI